jgi:hypothetical protein
LCLGAESGNRRGKSLPVDHETRRGGVERRQFRGIHDAGRGGGKRDSDAGSRGTSRKQDHSLAGAGADRLRSGVGDFSSRDDRLQNGS